MGSPCEPPKAQTCRIQPAPELRLHAALLGLGGAGQDATPVPAQTWHWQGERLGSSLGKRHILGRWAVAEETPTNSWSIAHQHSPCLGWSWQPAWLQSCVGLGLSIVATSETGLGASVRGWLTPGRVGWARGKRQKVRQKGGHLTVLLGGRGAGAVPALRRWACRHAETRPRQRRAQRALDPGGLGGAGRQHRGRALR